MSGYLYIRLNESVPTDRKFDVDVALQIFDQVIVGPWAFSYLPDVKLGILMCV